MKTYTVTQLAKKLHKNRNHVLMRWIRGNNTKGLKLKTTLNQRGWHVIGEKDLKEFILKLKGLDS